MHALRMFRVFLRPHWRWAVLAPLMMALEVAMDLMQPRLLQRVVDQGIARGDMAVVLHSGVWMVCVALVGLVGGVGCTVFSVYAGMGLGCDLRRALFGKIQTLSFGDLDRLETGALVTRLTSDVMQVQEGTMILLRIMVRAPLLLVGSLVMGLLTSPRLSLLFLVLMPALLALLVGIIRKTYPLFGEVQRRLDTLNTVLQENLAGVRVVKAFARAAHEIGRFGRANDDLMNKNVQAVRISAITMPSVMLIMNLGMVATLWLGGASVMRGGMHVGQVIAFLNYLMQTLMSLIMVSMLVLRMSRAEASAQRIDEVLRTEPEVRQPADPVVPDGCRGRVRLANVTFSYGGARGDPVLRDVSLAAEPGQTVALLGATGSGKSSLVNLIPRFYDVAEGSVTLDGVDVRSLDERYLHRHVAVALQESVLFSGTIRDNIRYGRPDATDDEVREAARLAQADEFVGQLADGYDTVVGQRGVGLSGGQKQRIAIARALLTEPAVLILDDSTSAVDVETEARIQDAMAAGQGARTCFVVAQRVSTVLGADKIVVLDDGQIAAEGTHEELLASSAVYRDIYASQAGSDEVDRNGS
jgi:ATP-binding cassette, subfamily B, multidrug efflux pump